MRRRKEATTAGITLVALVVTIVVLLILAGITINYVWGDNSVLSKAQQAKLEYQIAQAREKIEITFGHAQILKHTEIEYNQDNYLDELMQSEISNIKIIDDVIIVDGYAFEIDRSVPKIGQYLGKEEDLIFPEVSASTVLASDLKTATITINAKEATDGITKIEILQDGFVIETYTYENEKEPITENYVVKQNGIYVIKVYATLTGKAIVEVDGITMSIEYTPNGNEEYKKEHQVKITVKETDERVKSIKYQWLNTTVEPEIDTFTEICDNGAILTKNGVTGSYYLWTLLETEKGQTRIERSEAFHFDNQGPTVTLNSIPVSETSFTLSAIATDNYSEIKQYDFYVNGSLKNTQTTNASSASYTVTGANTGNTSCYVIVIDKLGNETKEMITGTTKLYTWEKWTTIKNTIYQMETKNVNEQHDAYEYGSFRTSVSINTTCGCFVTGSSVCSFTTWGASGSKLGYYTYPTAPSTTSRKACCVSSYSYSGSKVSVTIKVMEFVGSTTYSKGNSKVSEVTSTNNSAFPNNGQIGSYWYVYKGVY